MSVFLHLQIVNQTGFIVSQSNHRDQIAIHSQEQKLYKSKAIKSANIMYLSRGENSNTKRVSLFWPTL